MNQQARWSTGVLVADALRETPDRSDRMIAAAVGVSDKTVGSVRSELEANAEIPHKPERVDHKTVGKVRAELEAGAEIPHVEKRTDSIGRKQPATKPDPADAPTGSIFDIGDALTKRRVPDRRKAVKEAVDEEAAAAAASPLAGFIYGKPPAGIGLTPERLELLFSHPEATETEGRQAMVAEVRRLVDLPLAEHGGDRSGEEEGQDNNVILPSRQGNDPGYTRRRLRRDRPDLYERVVEAGRGADRGSCWGRRSGASTPSPSRRTRESPRTTAPTSASSPVPANLIWMRVIGGG